MFRGEKRGLNRGFSKDRSQKAQVAMEYLIIVGFVTLITVPLVIIVQEHSASTQQEISMNEARQIAKRIADAAETVYYLGKPSKTAVKTYFPSNVESVNISNYEILFSMRTTHGLQEVYVYVPLNISGNVTSTQGVHTIIVENKGGYIWVSE